MSVDRTTSSSRQPLLAFIETALILGAIATHGAWPTPDVNEAHYLSKAKHFWDPAWLQGDFFLESADAHVVFYALFGWITRLVSLPAAAWIGRVVTWAMLAASWRHLSLALVPRRWWAILTAGAVLSLWQYCELAGEWVVGGVESKGFAYALVFWALGEAVRRRWNRAAALSGAAISLHPLVGGWTAVALAFGWLLLVRDRGRLLSLVPGLLAAALLAAPGLYFALRIDAGVPEEIARRAHEIQFYERLHHHLDPFRFPQAKVLAHGALLLAWFAFLVTPYDAVQKRFRLFVMGAVLTGFVGLVLAVATQGHRELTSTALRYYWFRLGDVLLPAGVALVGFGYASRLRRIDPYRSMLLLGIGAAIGFSSFLGYGVKRILPDLPRSDSTKVASVADWKAVCSFVRQNTPLDARFLTPRSAQTFKWYAERSEVVNWKDMPQDARGVVEWWDRLHVVYWRDAAPGGPPGAGDWRPLTEKTPEELRALCRRYGATYLVTESEPPLELTRLYPPEGAPPSKYAVYRLE